MAAPLEMLAGVVAGALSAPAPRVPAANASARARRPSLSPVSSAATIAASTATTATTTTPAAAAAGPSQTTPRPAPQNPPPAKRLKAEARTHATAFASAAAPTTGPAARAFPAPGTAAPPANLDYTQRTAQATNPKHSRMAALHQLRDRERDCDPPPPPSPPPSDDNKDDDGDRRALRAERNRQSAAASRERKKRHVKDLEGRVRYLTDMVAAVQHRAHADAQEWLAKEQRYRDENRALRSQLSDALARSDSLLKPLRAAPQPHQPLSHPAHLHAHAHHTQHHQQQGQHQRQPECSYPIPAVATANGCFPAPRATVVDEHSLSSRQQHVVSAAHPTQSAAVADVPVGQHQTKSQPQPPSQAGRDARHESPHQSHHVTHLIHPYDPSEHQVSSQNRFHPHQQPPSGILAPQLSSSAQHHALSPYQHMQDFAPRALEMPAPPVHAGVPRPQQL